MTILDRLEEIRINERLNKKEFEGIIGKSSGYIGTLKKNKGVPGSDVIIKVSENFEKYNMDWLISGRGNMLKSENNPLFANDAKENYDLKDLNTVHIDIKKDLYALSVGMKENFKALNDAAVKQLMGQQKILDFVDNINAKEIAEATADIRRLIKQQK